VLLAEEVFAMEDGTQDDERRPLTDAEFSDLWGNPDFKEVVRAAATGKVPWRYSRILMEARVAAAQNEMVKWTKGAVFAAVGASILSIVVSLFLTATK